MPRAKGFIYLGKHGGATKGDQGLPAALDCNVGLTQNVYAKCHEAGALLDTI
jgi:hypothetical protein